MKFRKIMATTRILRSRASLNTKENVTYTVSTFINPQAGVAKSSKNPNRNKKGLVSTSTPLATSNLRVVPSRMCKSRPQVNSKLREENNNAPLETGNLPVVSSRKIIPQVTNASNFQETKCKASSPSLTTSTKSPRQRQPKPKVNKTIQRRTTRASIRELQEQQQKYANSGVKSRCLRVGRTVELVNQTTEEWRDQKSKLLFMLSLGFTPNLEKRDAEILPVIKLRPLNPSIVARILLKREIEHLTKRLQERRSARGQEIVVSDVLEVIDLVSGDEY